MQTHISKRTRLGATITRRSTKGSWTYKSQVHGRTYYFPLGYCEEDAKKLADTVRANLMLYPVAQVRAEFCQRILSRDCSRPPTIGQVVTTLAPLQKAMGWQTATMNDYWGSLRSVARKVTGKRDVDDVSCGDFTPAYLVKYRLRQLDGLTDHAEIQSRKRTINKNIRQLKAIFTKKTLKLLSGYDMSFVPDLREEDYYGGLGTQYRLPDGKLITDTFNLWAGLQGDEYVLMGLALHLGMRREEAYHARHEWFDLRGDRSRVAIRAEKDFRPKAGHEGFVMGDKAITAAILNKTSCDDYLISDRSDSGKTLFKKVVKTLRGIGWDRPHPLHELRKLFGSYVATTESIYVAQKFLRHADASTTNESYADVIVEDDVLALWAA